MLMAGLAGVVIGGLLVSSTTGVGAVLILVGIALIAIPVVNYNNAKERYNARPSDSQIDQWLQEDLKNIVEKNPLPKLGIDKSELVAESLIVPGPIFWNVSGFNRDEVLRKEGNDKLYRYSIWSVQVFVFTENFLGSYKCYYNWLRDTYVGESTNEFFYKDVVSVKTDTESTAYSLFDGHRLEHALSFQLNLAGDSVKVIVDDVNLKTSNEIKSMAEKAVQSLRAMIRQKKS
jgi:hypothetical protein